MTVLKDNYIEKYRIKMKFKHTNSSPSIRRRIDINYGEIKKKPNHMEEMPIVVYSHFLWNPIP